MTQTYLPNAVRPVHAPPTARLTELACLGHHPRPCRDASAVSDRTRERLLELGLLHDAEHARKYDRAQFVELATWVYPTASEAQLQVCHDWHMWLFCFDDRVDSLDGHYAGADAEMRAVARLSLEALRHGVEHADPLAIYALDIRRALLALGSERWLQGFCDAVEDYLEEGTFVAARHHRDGTVPGVDAFIAYRTSDSAMHTVIRLAELLSGGELGDRWHQPQLRALRILAAEAGALQNDLFSYEKEVIWNHCPNNLVHVVMVEHGIGFPAAVARCIRLIDDRYRGFMRLRARLFAEIGEQDLVLRRFVDGMKVWVEASADWGIMSGRYCSTTSPFAELRVDERREAARRSA
jgi:Terpene synthase family 2, C-terminal metal binding